LNMASTYRSVPRSTGWYSKARRLQTR